MQLEQFTYGAFKAALPSRARARVKRGLQRLVLGSPLVSTLPPESGKVALTFDDGPHPEHTPKVLQLLGRHGIKACFFLIGECAARNPDLVRAILDAGHEVGGHSQSHRPPNDLRSMRLVAEEVGGCLRTLTRICDTPPRFYRPPYGQVTFRLLAYCRRANLVPVLWSLDPRDYAEGQTMGPAEFAAAVKPGDIVLLHDDRAKCPELLGHSLTAILGRGISFTTLGEQL